MASETKNVGIIPSGLIRWLIDFAAIRSAVFLLIVGASFLIMLKARQSGAW